MKDTSILFLPSTSGSTYSNHYVVHCKLISEADMSEGDNAVPAPREPPPPQPVFKEPRPVNPNSLPFFSRIVEDIIVNIFGRLEEDPRDLARLACVCRRFHNVVKSSCYKRQCLRVVPTIVSELMQSSTRQDVLGEPPGGWAALQKLLVCCPGLRPAGVLLNCWDFGLERDIGRSDDFELVHTQIVPNSGQDAEDDSSQGAGKNPVVSLKVFEGNNEEKIVGAHGNQSCCRKGTGQESALMAETMAKLESAILQTSETSGCSSSVETSSRNDDPTGIDDADSDAGKGMFGKRKNWAMMGGDGPIKQMKKGGIHYHNKVMNNSRFNGVYKQSDRDDEHGGIRSPRYRERRRSRQRSGDINLGRRITETEEAQVNHEEEPHLAKGAWILTREQGNKLLASRSV